MNLSCIYIGGVGPLSTAGMVIGSPGVLDDVTITGRFMVLAGLEGPL